MAHASSRDRVLVTLYLGAIVAANLLVSSRGQSALPLTAFLLIPFDLCTRDVLHESWHGRWLWPRMGALIAAGSVLSFAMNHGAGRVALASFCAFALAGATDAGVYHLARRHPKWVRMNGSNLFSSVVDSFVFPMVAFPSWSLWLVAAQAGSKFVGGIFWSWVYLRWIRRLMED